MEWIRRLICAMLWTAQGPVWATCLENMIPANNETTSRKSRMLLWTLCAAVFGTIHAFCKPGPVQMVNALAQFAVWGSLMWYCYSGRFLIRLGAFAVLMMIPQCLDVIISPAWCAFTGRTPAEHYARMGTDYVVIVAFIQLLAIILQGVACNLWCRRRQGRRSLRSSALMLGMALVVLCIFFAAMFSPDGDAVQFSGTYMAVASCLAFLLIGAVIVLLSWTEKDALRKDLDESRRVAELEQAHYASVEKRRGEMENIRSDYNRALTSVLGLLEQGKSEQARELLSGLSAQVAATKEAPFCGIPIINAVLTEKQAQCSSRGIILYADLLLPDNLSIRALDLCSAFSNLLDNAIRACRREQTISLTCRVNQGYLVIKCVNPSEKAPGAKPDHTGYGLKILRDLARRYHGYFHTDYLGQTFTAQLSLLAEEGENDK